MDSRICAGWLTNAAEVARAAAPAVPSPAASISRFALHRGPALFPGPAERDRLVRVPRVVEDCYRARHSPFRLGGKLQLERAMPQRRKSVLAARGLLFREREVREIGHRCQRSTERDRLTAVLI